MNWHKRESPLARPEWRHKQLPTCSRSASRSVGRSLRSSIRRSVRNSARRANAPRRAGAVLIVALVILAVVMALLGVLLQGTLRARRQLHVERDRRQAELLLDAGLARAAFRLDNEADYRGETWRLEPNAIVGGGAGAVTIAAARDEVHSPWKVHVVAEYPLGDERSVRRSRTVLLPISRAPPSSQKSQTSQVSPASVEESHE